MCLPSSSREEDDLDIDAIIEANKETLPVLPPTPVGPLKMKGLKGNAVDDEETRKGKRGSCNLALCRRVRGIRLVNVPL